MFNWLSGLFDSNDKELKRLAPIVAQVNVLESEFEKLTGPELRARSDDFKARLRDGGKHGRVSA